MAGGNIPRTLAPVFVQAGRQYSIPARVLAGVASVETNLGANKGPSSTGAVGLMQFEPGTAASIGLKNPWNDRAAIFAAAKLLNQYGYQQNPLRALGAYNGGPGNPQYAYARQVMSEAARLRPQLQGVMSDGGGGGTGPMTVPGAQPPKLGQVRVPFTTQSSRIDPASIAGSFLANEAQVNPWGIPGTSSSKISTGSNSLLSTGLLPTQLTTQTITRHGQIVLKAHNVLQRMAGQTSLKVAPGVVPGFKGYVNPIRGATIGRTDMGVDVNLPVGAPVRAIGDSRVVNIYPNWYQGQPYVLLQLLNGPQKGKYYYVAEQIAPRVHPGQVLHAGDPIGTYASSGTGIEIGWGTPTENTLAQATTGYSEGQVTRAGSSFRNFLGSLGAR